MQKQPQDHLAAPGTGDAQAQPEFEDSDAYLSNIAWPVESPATVAANEHTPERLRNESFADYRARRAASHRIAARIQRGY